MTSGIKVLCGCECSGVVRDAFLARGFDAWSCDTEPCETGSTERHLQCDVMGVLDRGWDLAIFFPPCTHLAVSGARHFPAKRASGVQQEALAFVRALLDAPIPHIALENPISIISSKIKKPDQIFHPYHFGHPELKSTCLWLKNLPRLVETDNVYGKMMTLPRNQRERVHLMPPGPNRARERARTFSGVGAAMAQQWGDHLFQALLQ